MADPVRRCLRQTTHSTRGAVLTGARWLGRQEASVLVAALCILLALFGFIKISEELGEGAGSSRRVGAPPSQSAG